MLFRSVGRQDILNACRKLLDDYKNGRIKESDINMQTFSDYLWTAGIPEPDLLIRTSGEIRISNFLLWQCAYTEMYFTDTLWPDFSVKDLHEAIKSYQGRERRFGGL